MALVALVAGASSGLGRAVARALAAGGLRTYAGARSFASGAQPPEGCIAVPLDVTDEASCRDAAAFVLAREGRIDALVNCAAVLTLGACEETGVRELSAVLETNLLGSVRMIQAVLPAMRRQGFGRIVQFSSLNGLFAIPFQSAYVASKHALEGFCEALAMETHPFGIRVTVLEPGDARSGSQAYRKQSAASLREDSPYRGAFHAAVAKIRRDEQGGLDPDRVARAVLRVLHTKRPPARRVVARLDQRLAMWLHDLLPGTYFYAIIRSYYRAGRGMETENPYPNQEEAL